MKMNDPQANARARLRAYHRGHIVLEGNSLRQTEAAAFGECYECGDDTPVVPGSTRCEVHEVASKYRWLQADARQMLRWVDEVRPSGIADGEIAEIRSMARAVTSRMKRIMPIPTAEESGK